MHHLIAQALANRVADLSSVQCIRARGDVYSRGVSEAAANQQEKKPFSESRRYRVYLMVGVGQ